MSKNHHSEIVDLDNDNIELLDKLPIHKGMQKAAGNVRVPNMLNNINALGIAKSIQIGDMLREFYGEDNPIGIWNIDYLVKPPATSKTLPWHSDYSYWNGSIFEKDSEWSAVSAWIPLCDITIDNACLDYVTGDVMDDVMDEHRFVNLSTHDEYKSRISTTAGMKRGQFILMNEKCYHTSGVNKSKISRQILIVRYTNTIELLKRSTPTELI